METDNNTENTPTPKFQLQRKILNEFMRVYFSREILAEFTEPAIKGMTFEHASPILDAIMEVRGVEAATIHPYHLIVQRAMAYNWEEIEPSILRLMTSLHLDLEAANKPLPPMVKSS